MDPTITNVLVFWCMPCTIFFTAIYLFSFSGQKYETRKKCFFYEFHILFPDTPKTRKFRALLNSLTLVSLLLSLLVSESLGSWFFLKRARQKFPRVHKCLVQKKSFPVYNNLHNLRSESPPSTFLNSRLFRKIMW